MPRQNEEPTQNQYGDEVHPAFGKIGAFRTSWSPPGAVLFDSDVRHQHTVRIQIETATRRRDLKSDWIHGGKQILELEMSEAQWASFVSSMNTSGVPCTLRWTQQDGDLPGLDYAPRLALTMAEAKEAARDAYGQILKAVERLEAVEAQEKPSVKDRRAALASLKNSIRNAPANVEFATKRLAEHAEEVVQKSRADIEAMVYQQAVAMGLGPADMKGLIALPAFTTSDEVEPRSVESGDPNA